jgi:hypothetical protein
MKFLLCLILIPVILFLQNVLNKLNINIPLHNKIKWLLKNLKFKKPTDILTWLTLLLALLESSGNPCFCEYCAFLCGDELLWVSFRVPFGDPLPKKN